MHYDGCMPSGKPKAGESLADLFPDVASQWDYEKNEGKTPDQFTVGSSKKVWWKCDKGPDHEWHAPPKYRTKGGGCPFCSGKSVSVTNSFESLYPDIAKEWHPTKNGDLTPEKVTSGSRKKIWWKCDKGPDHEWQAAPDSRRSRGCPFCSNQRVSVTNSLKTLYPEIAEDWHPTKNGELTPESIVPGSKKKVWWKCNKGPDHEWQAAPDERTRSGQGCSHCAGKKVSVTNSLETLYPEIAKEWHPTKNGEITPSDVIARSGKRYWWICEKGPDHEWEASCHARTKPLGCPFCRGFKVSVTNSLLLNEPLLASQWHPTKNGDLNLEDITVGTNKKIWWKCDVADDHVWNVSPSSRIGYETGCPFCLGQRVSTSNSLKAIFPDIAKDWHPTKNGELTPADVTTGANRRVWWKCDKGPDHEWRALISSRTPPQGQGCPACSIPAKLLSITNSLATLFPEVASQWHPTKNGDLTPENVIAGNKKKAWWKCNIVEEHEWEASIQSRQNRGCPYCTLTPRSAQEIQLAFELSSVIDFDVEKHKIRAGGRLRDVDICLEDLNLVIEFDGNYWHRDKVEKDIAKTQMLENSEWTVIRVRQNPLESIHKNDVMVEPFAPVKEVADLVLQKIVEIIDVKIPKLKEYLASDEAWREKEALVAIREYQAENARKKAERDAKRKAKKKS